MQTKTCPTCNGEGKVEVPAHGNCDGPTWITCIACGGSGVVPLMTKAEEDAVSKAVSVEAVARDSGRASPQE